MQQLSKLERFQVTSHVETGRAQHLGHANTQAVN